ncbi:MAG TPA: sigma-70 family RNA polymerase sigma factor [Polyangiaceae bacterium]
MNSAENVVPIAEPGEEIDLDRVYREHGATVSRWVRRLSGSSDASDTLQEVFEVAQRRLSDFRGDAQLTTWLYSITIRVVSSRRRKARLRELLFLQAKTEFELDAQSAETPADSLHRRQATRIVYAVLDKLSERDRTLLILFELERLPTSEIATILELTENNVSVSLHRARERFRKLLRLHFPDEAQGIGP